MYFQPQRKRWTERINLSPDVSASRIQNFLSHTMFLLLSIPSRIWGWREAVGQAVWAVRYLKPESTLPPCVSFIGDHRENLQVMRSDRLTAIALASLLLEKCEDEKREPKHSLCNLRNHCIRHAYYVAFSHVAYTQYISLYCTWRHMAQTFEFI